MGIGRLSNDDEIDEFVKVHIPTIWALEILLTLHADPHRRWLAPELIKELRASTTLIDENLSRFERHGLALKDGLHWYFAPANPLLQAMTDQLSILYRERPVHVMGLITRADPIRSLAQAFRIRKDES